MNKKWKHDKNNGFREHTHRHTYTCTLTHNEIAFSFVPAWNAVEGKEIPQRLVTL